MSFCRLAVVVCKTAEINDLRGENSEEEEEEEETRKFSRFPPTESKVTYTVLVAFFCTCRQGLCLPRRRFPRIGRSSLRHKCNYR